LSGQGVPSSSSSTYSASTAPKPGQSHRNVGCSTGIIPELTFEDRPQQAFVAGAIAALGGDVPFQPTT
jgi:hypothetical protein